LGKSSHADETILERFKAAAAADNSSTSMEGRDEYIGS
jgi:hypothetical protein